MLILFILFSNTHNLTELEQVIIQQAKESHKMKINSELIALARNRTQLTAKIIHTYDVFEQDKINMQLDVFAAQFARLRTELLTLEMYQTEKNIIEKQNTIIPKILPKQRQAVELAMSNELNKVRKSEQLLYDFVLPGQEQLISLFAQLITYEQTVIGDLSQNARQSISTMNKNSNLIIGFALLFILTASVIIIFQIKKIQSKLKRFAEEAFSANRAKSEFLSTMSHEIRTPMNGIIGMLELLQRSPLESDQQRFASTASKSADNLLNIINEILDFSKIEAGKLTLENTAFQLSELLEDCTTLLAESAHAKKIELICNIDTKLPAYVMGDPTRLRQIIINLLSNAIKFTHTGEVVLRCYLPSNPQQPQPDRIHFEVRDTGIGIPVAAQQKLFNAFTQADGSTTRKYGGTGLGLAISQRLTKLMDGLLSIDSAEGKGSCFYFDLPLPEATTPITDIGDNRQMDSVLISNSRILVVDDNQTNLDVISGYLKNFGLAHDTAESAESALIQCHAAQAKGQLYTLALLDYNMPEIDGGQLAQTLKADGDLSAMPLVLLSSSSILDNEAKTLGFSAWLDKPIRQSELKNILFELLQPNQDTSITAKKSSFKYDSQASFNGNILVVDDLEINRFMAESALTRMGLSVVMAENGQQAVECWQQGDIDLILMDVRMPVMDGYEATQAIRQQQASEQSLHIPIIAMSADAMETDIKRCLDEGMDDCLPKPFRLHELESLINKWLPDAQKHSKSGETHASTPATKCEDNLLALDMDRINEFLDTFQNRYELMVNKLLDSAEVSMGILAQAGQENDLEKLLHEGHKLKGAMGTIGAPSMMECCRLIEHNAKENNLQFIKQQLEILPSIFEKFKLALNHHIQQRNNYA